MARTTDDPRDADALPSLWVDPAYHGMNVTQFLGAFNDNLFKQLVLLLCVDVAKGGGRDYQTFAGLLFALPFVLFSGFAGFLADRIAKRHIIVAMKIAELGVMTAGFFAFHTAFGRLGWLLAVVFLMGTHSAFFGPAKYGILPEMFRQRDLPQVNGMIQMTTFLSIILGMALAGFIKEWFRDRLWVGSATCIGIAAAGIVSSLWVRRTLVAHPGLPYRWSALFISGETWRMIRHDPPLFQALIASSLFWFLGGVVQFQVNAFGKLQLGYGDGRTSVMAVCMAIGIMVGCLSAGGLSKGRIRFGFVTTGAWGIVVCLCAVTAVGALAPVAAGDASTAEHAPETLREMIVPGSQTEWLVRGALIAMGISAGFFVVPLAVFMQVRPPKDQKGRMIGAMNLVNWIGILLAAIVYGIAERVCVALNIPRSWIFVLLAMIMLPLALFYAPDGEGSAEPAS